MLSYEMAISPKYRKAKNRLNKRLIVKKIKMSENERSLGSGMKSFIKNIDNLNQNEPGGEEENPQNNEISFCSELSAILKDLSNEYHYLCLKWHTFPYIEIIDKNTIKYRCQCIEKEKETKKDKVIDKEKDKEEESSKIMKIKDLINNIKDEKNKNDNEIIGLICDKHKKKFSNFCSNCRENICENCFELHFQRKCKCDIFFSLFIIMTVIKRH